MRKQKSEGKKPVEGVLLSRFAVWAPEGAADLRALGDS